MRFHMIFLCSAAFWSATGTAQNLTQSTYPVIEPKITDDLVDVTSLSMIVNSPFELVAPGSPHMRFRTVFNGRYMSSSLQYRLDDNTFRDFNHVGSSDRDITINFGGQSRMFKCDSWPADCEQIVMRDGTSLYRSAEKSYMLTDRDGVIYEFMDLESNDIDTFGCDYFDDGCNYSGYYGSAYIRKIRYPDGTVLTQVHTLGTTRVSDNLGYVIDNGFVLTNPSGEIGRITLSNTQHPWNSNGPNYITIREYNGLGQEYRIETKQELERTCDGKSINYSNYLPIKIVSPQGVETNISYPPPPPNIYGYPGRRIVPVSAVSRAGRSWYYANEGRTDSLNHTTYYYTATRYNPYDQQNYSTPGCETDTAGKYITSTKDADNRITTYEYDGYYRLISTILPEGNREGYTYDSRGNLTSATRLSKQGALQSVFSAGFDSSCANTKTCNKPQWTRDALLRQTDYTYDPTHGGVLTETLPADGNGVRPRKRYTYAAMYATDGNGAPITADGPIYKLTAVSTCISAVPGNPDSCIGTADEQIEEYSYQHPRLMKTRERERTGDNSSLVDTSYSYDAKDRLVVVDGPRTDVDDRSYITYDAVGRKVFEISADPDGGGPLPRPITRHQYNLDSQEVRTDAGTGNATDGSDFAWASAKRMTYDNAGLLVKTEAIVP